MMGDKRRGTDPGHYFRNTEARLVLGFFLLLYLVGGGLIWLLYGSGAALLAVLCMTGGLLLFLLLYGLVTVLGRLAGE